MFFCSLIEELCTKEENYKTSCNFNFGHECRKTPFETNYKPEKLFFFHSNPTKQISLMLMSSWKILMLIRGKAVHKAWGFIHFYFPTIFTWSSSDFTLIKDLRNLSGFWGFFSSLDLKILFIILNMYGSWP